MKSILVTFLSASVLIFSSCKDQRAATQNDGSPQPDKQEVAAGTAFHELSIQSLEGDKTINFSEFKGKMVLCVNTASECGFTYQYEGLEKLHKQYGEKLVVIGFPCNQFGRQEPGSAEEIRGFCKKNYGVTFQLTEKINVKGNDKHPVYQWLTEKKHNGLDDYTVGWNFNKFLVDGNGNLVKHFGSKTKPMSEDILSMIQ